MKVRIALFAALIAAFAGLGYATSRTPQTAVFAQTGPVPTCNPDLPNCGMDHAKAPKK